MEVCFVDPRTVLEAASRGGAGPGAAWQLEQEDVNCIKVPSKLVKQLHEAHHELGDADEPLNSWAFGKRSEEMFHYRMIGMHRVQSGFTSIITRERLDSIREGSAAAAGPQLPTWQQLQAQLSATHTLHSQHTAEGEALEAQERGPTHEHPFLFAGRVVESDVAAVYSLSEDGEVVGLLVSSAAA